MGHSCPPERGTGSVCLSMAGLAASTDARREKYGRCRFCRRECALTFHHLIPKKLHRRVRFKKTYTREELNQGIAVCRQCHDGIHDIYDEMTLAKTRATPECLRNDPLLQKHFQWVAKQKVR